MCINSAASVLLRLHGLSSEVLKRERSFKCPGDSPLPYCGDTAPAVPEIPNFEVF